MWAKSCNPFSIDEAIKQIEVGATELLNKVGGIISLGGDHTIAVPLLRAINKKCNGPVALVHFDAHLDTWDTYFGAPYTHGTPFRRAREEGLFLDDASMHVGIRGPLYSRDDIKNDESFGFKIIHCDEFQTEGTDKIAERIKKRDYKSEWVFGFYNIYNRDNANSITFQQNEDTLKNEAVQISIFGIVPSVTYNFKF